MTWDIHHSNSEKLAIEAETARRAGEDRLAEELYRRACEEEQRAFDDLPLAKERTRGITAVSSVALSYKAQEYALAERLAYKYLAEAGLEAFAAAHLKDLLQVIWTTRAARDAGIRFVSGDVLVSVKGGEIIYGGAPLELVIQKIEVIKALLFRTAEMLLNRPFRKRGLPQIDVQSLFRPWLFQAPAGSYQFAVRVERPRQAELFEDHNKAQIQQVTATFFEVLRASAEDPANELPKVVQDDEYRNAFLNLSRNLSPSPTAKAFDTLEVRDVMAPLSPIATFGVDTRERVNVAIRSLRGGRMNGEELVDVRGILRALDLDKDWLEIATGDTDRIQVREATEVLDDVIGPMVNHKVVVSAVQRGRKYLYRDIELDE